MKQGPFTPQELEALEELKAPPLKPVLKKVRAAAARLEQAIADLPLDLTPRELREPGPGAPDLLREEMDLLTAALRRATQRVDAVIAFKSRPGPESQSEMRFFQFLRAYSELTSETGMVPTARRIADHVRGGPATGVSKSGDQVFREAQDFLSFLRKRDLAYIPGKPTTVRGDPSISGTNIP